MYRFYTGKDGLSHVEKIEVKNFDQNNVANLMDTTTGATLSAGRNPMHRARISERSIRDRVGNIFSILPAMKKWNFREGRKSP